MERSCSCGCGKSVSNYVKECFPVAPWDTKELPKRTMEQRCPKHWGKKGSAACAYRDDDPLYCPNCHRRESIGCDCVEKKLITLQRKKEMWATI